MSSYLQATQKPKGAFKFTQSRFALKSFAVAWVLCEHSHVSRFEVLLWKIGSSFMWAFSEWLLGFAHHPDVYACLNKIVLPEMLWVLNLDGLELDCLLRRGVREGSRSVLKTRFERKNHVPEIVRDGIQQQVICGMFTPFLMTFVCVVRLWQPSSLVKGMVRSPKCFLCCLFSSQINVLCSYFTSEVHLATRELNAYRSSGNSSSRFPRPANFIPRCSRFPSPANLYAALTERSWKKQSRKTVEHIADADPIRLQHIVGEKTRKTSACGSRL